MALREALGRVLADYPTAVLEPFTQHRTADFLRHELADELRSVVGDKYRIDGSAGQGKWAETPWAAVLDPAVTTSAQKGYYVVYLFRSDGRGVLLSLNQATTEVRRAFPGQYRQVLAARAQYAVDLLEPFGLDGMIPGPVDLGGAGSNTRGYEAGNIAGISYARDHIPDDPVLGQDLHRLLSLYGTYKAARDGQIEGGVEDLPPDVSSGEEAKRYRWHRRAERNRKLSAAAKAFHGYVCAVCAFDFQAQYGDVGKEYIEAHHLTPMAELATAPEPTVLDPKTDFACVCSNCHRMLHRSKPIITPVDLSTRVQRRWATPDIPIAPSAWSTK